MLDDHGTPIPGYRIRAVSPLRTLLARVDERRSATRRRRAFESAFRAWTRAVSPREPVRTIGGSAPSDRTCPGSGRAA